MSKIFSYTYILFLIVILVDIIKREQILCYADRYRQTPCPITKYAHAYREHLLIVNWGID